MSQAGIINVEGSGTGPVETLTGNTGGAVPPTGGNINVVGTGGISVAGNPGTSTLTISASGGLPYYSLTPYIVGPDVHSQYTTIGAAITAAVAGGASSTAPANIYIKPQAGGYTENPTLVDGINLIGFGASAVINGTVGMSTAGTATLSGLTLQTNSNYALSITGSGAVVLYISNCFIAALNHTAININNSSSAIFVYNCHSTSSAASALFTIPAGDIEFDTCYLRAFTSAPAASTITAGSVDFSSSQCEFPISISSTGGVSGANCHFSNGSSTVPVFVLNGTQIYEFKNCSFFANDVSTATAITIGGTAGARIANCVIDSENANAISGTGTLEYGLITFLNSSGVSVSTLTPLATLT